MPYFDPYVSPRQKEKAGSVSRPLLSFIATLTVLLLIDSCGERENDPHHNVHGGHDRMMFGDLQYEVQESAAEHGHKSQPTESLASNDILSLLIAESVGAK